MLTKQKVWSARTVCVLIGLGGVLGIAAFGVALAQDMVKAPAGAKVKITSPATGATIKNPVKIVMSVTGMAVTPAGAPKEGTGHHHLIIDGGPMPEGAVIPVDETHLHFGKGQTETEMNMAAGKHTITAQFADGLHRSYGPALSDTITITVEIY